MFHLQKDIGGKRMYWNYSENCWQDESGENTGFNALGEAEMYQFMTESDGEHSADMSGAIIVQLEVTT